MKKEKKKATSPNIKVFEKYFDPTKPRELYPKAELKGHNFTPRK